MWFVIFLVSAVGATASQFNVPTDTLLFASVAGGWDNVSCLTRSNSNGKGCLAADIDDLSKCYSLVTQSGPLNSHRFKPSPTNLSEWPSMHIRDAIPTGHNKEIHNAFKFSDDPAIWKRLPPIVLAWYCQSQLQSDPQLKRSSEFFIYDGDAQRCYFANSLPEIPPSNFQSRFIAGPQYCDSTLVTRQLDVNSAAGDRPNNPAAFKSEVAHLRGQAVAKRVALETTITTTAITTTTIVATTIFSTKEAVKPPPTTTDTGGDDVDSTPTTSATDELPSTGLPATVAVGAAFGGLAVVGALGVGGYLLYTKNHTDVKSADDSDVPDISATPHFEVHPTASFFM